MPTYLYCILPGAGESRGTMPAGLGGSTVRVLAAGPLDAWVGTVPERAIPPTVEAVRIHDAVVMAALDGGESPLPARFGQVFDSDDACRAALVEQGQRMESDLARVRGL